MYVVVYKNNLGEAAASPSLGAYQKSLVSSSFSSAANTLKVDMTFQMVEEVAVAVVDADDAVVVVAPRAASNAGVRGRGPAQETCKSVVVRN